jgi:UDP-N-acetylglucosamine--dolichyl-phosphate N-acetylglucosaminephosphotransferase
MELMWLLILSTVSFLAVFTSLPSWTRRATKTGFVGKDVHKNNIEVPELGGITVVLGTVISLLIYIALETFYFKGSSASFILAAVATILIAAMIGMTDDMLGWKIGLRQREKVLLTLFVPIPLMVVNAGVSTMRFPFLGDVELGLLYPLLVLPIGVVVATNAFNMLAGYNGLEAGMGVIILSTLGFLSWKTGSISAAIIAFSMVFALAAFLFYNRYPSKVFPGDVLTYSVGATAAIVAILGNLERFAVMLFFPYSIDFFLKARKKLMPDWPAEVLEDGSLAVKDKIYSVPHLAIYFLRKIKGSAREPEVVLTVLLFELAVALVTICSFSIRVLY